MVLISQQSERPLGEVYPTSKARVERFEVLLGRVPSMSVWTEVLDLVELEHEQGFQFSLDLSRVKELNWGLVHRVNPRRWAPYFVESPSWIGFGLFAHIELGQYDPTDEMIGRMVSSGHHDELESLSLRGSPRVTDVGLAYLSTQTLPSTTVLDLRELPKVTTERLIAAKQSFERVGRTRVLI